jgi:hypothetical protein
VKYKHVKMPNLRLGAEDAASLVEYLDLQPPRQAHAGR